MSLSLTQIEHEVDLLPSEDQQTLLSHLERRFALSSSELDKVWGEEAQKRFKSYKAGKSKAYPADKVIKDLKSELAARRK
ncbi:MAG: addiction module protein [Victivallaceae bacterium]|nr:addiction module protein [Victivallaceae bacterium]